jgi:hypothetical protein
MAGLSKAPARLIPLSLHDRLKMLLLSNRKSNVFDEVDIHNILSLEFVVLYESS